jgi:cytochrome c biogenesis protein CcdA
VAGHKIAWLGQASLYTLGGLVTSVLVGAGLAAVGGLVIPAGTRPFGIVVALVVAVLAALRELGWVRLPLPEPKRQTRDLWAKTFSPPVAATLWGLDLGLLVSTRLTFAGAWLVLLLAALTGSPRLGATLTAAYWLGRALPVWIAPLLFENAGSSHRVLDELDRHRQWHRMVHVLGLGLMAAVLFSTLLSGA